MKKVLVFTGWYPSENNHTRYSFVSQQVKMLNKWLPKITGEEWSFIVWNEQIPNDIAGKISGKSFCNRKWYDEDIPVYVCQGMIISHRLPFNQSSILIPNLNKTYKKIRREKIWEDGPDLVWCITLSGAMLWRQFMISNHILNIPFIIQEHSVPLSMHLKTRVQRKLAPPTIEASSEIVVVAERQLEEFKRINPSIEPTLIWNAVDESFLTINNNAIKGEVFTFLFVGRISAQKGFHRLIIAASLLKEKAFNISIKVIGTGELELNMKKEMADLGLSSIFEWLGIKSSTEISEIMDVCHAFVLPSLYENCPVALLEAQVKGLPCVVTANGASEKVLLSGNGIAVEEEGDGENLAKAMQQLISEYASYDSERIRARSLKQFSPEVFARKMYAVFKEVLQ